MNLSPLLQNQSGNPSTGALPGIDDDLLSAVEVALNITSLATLLDGLLPYSLLWSINSECPSECLMSLAPYSSTLQKTMVLLLPSDVLNISGLPPMSAESELFCAASRGYCGADIPLLLYYSTSSNDSYIGLEAEQRPGYSLQNSGQPLCFVWPDVNYTTATTTTTAAATTTTTANSTVVPSYNETSSGTFTDATATSPPPPVNGTVSTTSADGNATTENTSPPPPWVANGTGPTTPPNGNATSVLPPSQPPPANSTAGPPPGGPPDPNNPYNPGGGNGNNEYGRRSARSWPIIAGAVILLGVVVLTVLALSTVKIVRSSRGTAIQPSQDPGSPPPPYPYNHGTATDLPPAPVNAMSAPRPFTVGAPMQFTGAPPGFY
ncbi:unnamed protein product [Heligmosomoides polygyrus]|uniref:Uncharacterized protein n=1 Tax=Heligmosomoides polygyrus TaxID=6339 RepID=A0A3P8CG52_HELPZ|nr:unnamed protein product [Heligmosomoides polygyrus]